jgi:hypothetical protein
MTRGKGYMGIGPTVDLTATRMPSLHCTALTVKEDVGLGQADDGRGAHRTTTPGVEPSQSDRRAMGQI